MPIPSADPEHIWFEASLKDNEASDDTRSGQRKSSERITMGLPIAIDLLSIFSDSKSIPVDIQQDTKQGYQFWLLRFACTVHDGKVGLSWAEFGLEFSYPLQLEKTVMRLHPFAKEQTMQKSEIPPIAHDLFPQQLDDESDVQKTVTLQPNLTFGDVELSVGSQTQTLSYKSLHPRIVGHGKRESKIYWRILPGKGDKLAIGIREFDLILRKHKDYVAQIKPTLQGQGKLWGIIPQNLDISKNILYV